MNILEKTSFNNCKFEIRNFKGPGTSKSSALRVTQSASLYSMSSGSSNVSGKLKNSLDNSSDSSLSINQMCLSIQVFHTHQIDQVAPEHHVRRIIQEHLEHMVRLPYH